MDYEFEECRTGYWKAEFEEFEPVAESIREKFETEVDTDNLILFHAEGVKCTFPRSSATLTIRTGNRERAEEIAEKAAP
ncbi:MAG: hypothetical protein ABEJ62_00385 [Candidatus Nanohaloarchaea archaeon]